jgi:Zn-dependent protease with chaperone function
LDQALDQAAAPSRSPLRLWARLCRRWADSLIGPIARGQEARADRCAATIAGGDAAASALVKVALVQPLFREVLEHYDPTDPNLPNLYAFFREFWLRLPDSLHTAMRLSLLAGKQQTVEGAHPPLPDRLTVVQSYPHRETPDHASAKTALSDLEALEQMLHNRLFSTPGIEPSVFHRAGT